jgi:transcriptional regulator with XRE-family HTH domain
MARSRKEGADAPDGAKKAATPAGQRDGRPPHGDHDLTDVRVSLGLTVRELRLARGLSARRLASLVGVTSGFMSQLENGQTTPSLATLLRIAAALEVRIGDLFHATPKSQIVRRAERPQFDYPDLGMRDEILSKDPKEQLEVLIGYIDPAGGSGEERYTHGAETEFILVLAGTIDIWLADKKHTLNEGDSITFSGDMPHAFTNPGEVGAQVLWVYSPASY